MRMAPFLQNHFLGNVELHRYIIQGTLLTTYTINYAEKDVNEYCVGIHVCSFVPQETFCHKNSNSYQFLS